MGHGRLKNQLWLSLILPWWCAWCSFTRRYSRAFGLFLFLLAFALEAMIGTFGVTVSYWYCCSFCTGDVTGVLLCFTGVTGGMMFRCFPQFPFFVDIETEQ